MRENFSNGMNCIALIPSISKISHHILVTLRVMNSIIALLNIIANAFLIYALKKTGQTTTISLQLILLMSLSDFVTGITSLSLTNILLWKQFDSLCYLKTLTQFVHVVFVGFSCASVLLIALDRFLHMKYLQRYSIVMSKRRAYILIMSTFCFYLVSATIFSMSFLIDEIEIIQLVFFLLGIPIIITIFMFYYKACNAITCKVSTVQRNFIQNTIVQSKGVLKAAKRITICFAILLMPLIISHIILAVNRRYKILNTETMATFKWFCYIGGLANGFCNCCIFVLQNRPVRKLLTRILYKREIRVDVRRNGISMNTFNIQAESGKHCEPSNNEDGTQINTNYLTTHAPCHKLFSY